MGRDKGLLELQDTPLILWVVDRMRPLVDEIVVSTSAANTSAYRRVLPEDVPCVPDAAAQMGPLGGWQTALPVLRGEYLAMAPCDAPLYSTALAEHLFDRATGHDGAVPRLQKYFEPLHAVYHREHLLDALRKTLAMGLNRPVHTYAHLDIVEVGEPEIRRIDADLDSFRTSNTPEEFEGVKRRAEELGIGTTHGPRGARPQG